MKLNVSVQNTGYLKDIKVALDGNNYELNDDDETSSKGSFAEIANNSESSATSNANADNVTATTSNDGKDANVASTTNEQSENVVDNNNIATTVTSNSIGNNTTATSETGNATTATSEAGNATTTSNAENATITDSNTDEKALATNNLDSKNDASQIKSINDNVIELNEVNAGESKTVEVKKSIKQKLEWTVNTEEQISQKLVRYLKFDKNTLISFEINEGIKDNSVPVTNKEINITSPKINNSNPQNVVVTGKDINYTYNNGNITIKKEVKPDSNGNYSFDSQDDYMVTYIYNTQENISNISTSAKANVTNIKGENITAETQNNDFQVKEEVGSIVELNVNAPEQIGKGYLYTNLNRNEKLNGKVSDAKVKTSKIAVDSNEVAKVLGDDGTIVVKDGSGKELGTLNKGRSWR